MGESEKPFACPSPGCNMSFTNEDHLVVHKKKHDMILNLGNNKTGVFVADQTPTPTRFIRNCEEVGLFQDLQNVNPFEETFRRAVESGKIGSLPDTEIDPNDDTLHTPHVFPQLDEEQSTGSRKLSPEITEISSKNNHSTCLGQKICEDKQEVISCEVTQNITSKTTIKKTTETIVIQEADTSVTPVVGQTANALSINGEEVQLLLKTDDGKLMQLSAIPVCGTNSLARITSQPMKPIVVKSDISGKRKREGKDDKTSRLSIAKKKLKEVLLKSDSSQERIEKTDHNENHFASSPEPSVLENGDKTTDIRKKQEILARNRASSMRARAKRKQWIQQVQKSLHTANELNSTLQVEVKSLRSEVAKLKTLLLAHKDCPITKAMEKGNNIVVGTQVIPVSAQFIQATNSGIKLQNEPPTANNKQSVLLQKQAIILPKLEEKNLPICVAKIIRNPMKIGETEEEKSDDSILVVQNVSPRKTQVTQVIHIDQSLQMINVASKSTGT